MATRTEPEIMEIGEQMIRDLSLEDLGRIVRTSFVEDGVRVIRVWAYDELPPLTED